MSDELPTSSSSSSYAYTFNLPSLGGGGGSGSAVGSTTTSGSRVAALSASGFIDSSLPSLNASRQSLNTASSSSLQRPFLYSSDYSTTTTPLPAAGWIKCSECDEFIGPRRSKHTMVCFDNSLYVFGGDNGKNMLNDLVTYDLKNNSWGRALNSNPPTPRYHHTSVVYNNSMFVFGGYTGDINSNSNLCNKNDLYEYKNGAWTMWNIDKESRMPTPRAGHGAIVYDHKLWIFAGYDGNYRLNDMWYIRLNNSPNAPKMWIEVGQLGDQPPTVCNFPLAVVQNSMYLFSGQSGQKTSNSLFKFDFKTYVWSKISSNPLLRGSSTPPPEKRSGHIMVAHENKLYIYGGILGNSFISDVYSFDLETLTWELILMHQKPPAAASQIFPSGRSFLAAVVHNEFLYVFGGNGEQNIRSNELFKLKLQNQPRSTLKEDLFKLLKTELFSDLRFICSGNRVVNAHCSIVACRSAYCRQLIKASKDKRNGNGGGSSNANTASEPNLHQENNNNNNISTGGASLLAASAISSSPAKKFLNVSNATICNSASTSSLPKSSAGSTEDHFGLARFARLPPMQLHESEPIEIKLASCDNPECLKLVLEFLYTDRIISLEGSERELTTLKLIIDVYKLSNQFMIQKLNKICEILVESSINCSNVLNLLYYIDNLNLPTLKESCMSFLIKDSNFNQVIMLSEFEQLESSLMVEIIRRRQATTPKKAAFTEEKCEEKYSTLEQDLESFLRKDIGNEFSDILLMLGENQPPILAHKCVLAARCHYFEAYFRSFMPKDKRISLTIGDAIPPRHTCWALLRYIYYDDVNLAPEDALYLFTASHFFQFSNMRLHVFCKQILEANVSKNNVFDILEAADKIHDMDVKNFALNIIRSNFYEMANSNRIKKLSKDLLIDIIQDISNMFVSNILNNTVSPSSQDMNVSSMASSSSSDNMTTAAAALSSATVFLPFLSDGLLSQQQQHGGAHSPSAQGSHSPFAQRSNMEFMFANRGGGAGADTTKN